ncbi:hypothetical protein [Melittangium boletus]|uniref:Uncharacterized protein n=1 Tax=Melittangium boletus DSM 14713 TaxID=1294270 RepID=A0A250IS35_9BACT|nr:hypothetical protein [Melittangium boletus]ATB34575.1 hypothetical protein MEBOL_008080 [Melittangium boletus DSM 14713]
MVRKLTATAALLALSCAPQTQVPMKVRALVLSSNGAYEPTEVELKTVTDIVSLEGKVARIQGNAILRLASTDPEVQAAQTEEALARAMTKDEGRSITASYITDPQGVLWPADFHTWNLVTTYYNLERAWDYFTNVVAVPQAELPQTTVHYFPEFVLADVSDQPQRDNALFYPPLKSFLVLPFDKLQKAPLATNASILTHEYAHLVFNRRVYGGSALPAPLNNWAQSGDFTPGLNVIKALDEGLADFHAYVASCQDVKRFGCNTRVLAYSFEDVAVNERDLATPRCMGQLMYNNLTRSSVNVLPNLAYEVGTLLANALFMSTTTDAEKQTMARAIVAAYSDTDAARPGFNQLAASSLNDQTTFTLIKAAKAIIQHIPAGNVDLRQKVCTNFATRLQIPVNALTGNTEYDCPASTTTTTDCPAINLNP